LFVFSMVVSRLIVGELIGRTCGGVFKVVADRTTRPGSRR
jgi:hypothetical protein